MLIRGNRNYAVVVAAGVLVFALIWWFAGARKYAIRPPPPSFFGSPFPYPTRTATNQQNDIGYI